MITVFTPVYNRAYIINQLYQSLLRQTNYGFEWLIIDDGSTDNIAELVSQWIADTEDFEIRLYRQPNGGKHRAINRGVQLAKGDAFLIVDSDDYLTEDAIDTVNDYWTQIQDKPELAGVSGLRMHQNGQMIGGRPKFQEYIDATNLERIAYGLEGDKAEVYKTEILKEFPFPDFEGERFITEAVIWNKIAYRGYKLRWFKKSILICDYLEDGLTANGSRLLVENPRGWAAFLCGEKIYQAWNEMFYMKQCFYYYEKEHLYAEPEKIAELLELDDSEMNIIKEAYFSLNGQLAELCKDKKVCIYGYGAWGKRLKKYLDEINISVEYIIDQKRFDTEGTPQYTPESALPGVNIMFVALKNGADDVIKMLGKKLKNAEIICLKEIVEEWW